jgi:hypothetical protein
MRSRPPPTRSTATRPRSRRPTGPATTSFGKDPATDEGAATTARPRGRARAGGRRGGRARLACRVVRRLVERGRGADRFDDDHDRDRLVVDRRPAASVRRLHARERGAGLPGAGQPGALQPHTAGSPADARARRRPRGVREPQGPGPTPSTRAWQRGAGRSSRRCWTTPPACARTGCRTSPTRPNSTGALASTCRAQASIRARPLSAPQRRRAALSPEHRSRSNVGKAWTGPRSSCRRPSLAAPILSAVQESRASPDPVTVVQPLVSYNRLRPSNAI